MVAILRGEFGETELKILGTLLALFVDGRDGISGLSLVERRSAMLLGWAAVAGAVVGFAVVTAATWDEFGNETLSKSAVSAMALVLALLCSRRSGCAARRALRLVFYGTAVAAAIGVGLSLAMIWGEDSGGDNDAGRRSSSSAS